MLWVSELMMQEHEVTIFEELLKALVARAFDGEMHFGMDVKPPYSDTPDNWEEVLENTFSSAR